LLLAAIGVATGSVTLIATAGPAWPDSFAHCSGEGIYAQGSARDQAIEDWQAWWRPVYLVGLAISTALVLVWMRAVRWRPERLIGAGIVALALGLSAAGVLGDQLKLVSAVPALAWATALDFPERTSFIAPALYVLTVCVSIRVMRHASPRTRRITQWVLLVLLASGWISLLAAGFPSDRAFSC
jgi:hypothetical protein